MFRQTDAETPKSPNKNTFIPTIIMFLTGGIHSMHCYFEITIVIDCFAICHDLIQTFQNFFFTYCNIDKTFIFCPSYVRYIGDVNKHLNHKAVCNNVPVFECYVLPLYLG